ADARAPVTLSSPVAGVLPAQTHIPRSGGPRNRTSSKGFGDPHVTVTPVPQKCRFAGTLDVGGAVSQLQLADTNEPTARPQRQDTGNQHGSSPKYGCADRSLAG